MTVETAEFEVDEAAALYVAGSVTLREFADWEPALATKGSPESNATAEYERALLELTSDIAPVAPPAGIKAALLHSIARPQGFTFKFADEGGFKQSPIPGIEYRRLHRDPVRRRVTCLLRLAPGARLPVHSHSGVEECIVLEGNVYVGNTRLRTGDYQRAEPDSEHVEQWTDTGALLYLSAPDDLFL